MPSKSNRVSRKSLTMSMPKLSKKTCKILTLVLSIALVLVVLFLLNKYVFKINVTENFQNNPTISSNLNQEMSEEEKNKLVQELLTKNQTKIDNYSIIIKDLGLDVNREEELIDFYKKQLE